MGFRPILNDFKTLKRGSGRRPTGNVAVSKNLGVRKSLNKKALINLLLINFLFWQFFDTIWLFVVCFLLKLVIWSIDFRVKDGYRRIDCFLNFCLVFNNPKTRKRVSGCRLWECLRVKSLAIINKKQCWWNQYLDEKWLSMNF